MCAFANVEATEKISVFVDVKNLFDEIYYTNSFVWLVPGSPRAVTTGIISINDLIVERGGRTMLDMLSLLVATGKIYALLGGDGAGKSTTLLALLGF